MSHDFESRFGSGLFSHDDHDEHDGVSGPHALGLSGVGGFITHTGSGLANNVGSVVGGVLGAAQGVVGGVGGAVFGSSGSTSGANVSASSHFGFFHNAVTSEYILWLVGNDSFVNGSSEYLKRIGNEVTQFRKEIIQQTKMYANEGTFNAKLEYFTRVIF
jgi:hypothetical protein